jgi:hypothetical protein
MSPSDHLSERELGALTRQLDEMHHDEAMPSMNRAVEEWSAQIKEGRPEQAAQHRVASRRTFLMGAGALGAGGLIFAACGSSKPHSTGASGSTSGTGSPSTSSSSGSGSDLQVAAMAASLENLAVFAYTAGISAAQAGKLGKVPPAVVTFATTAKSQHSDHASAWNAVLKSAGKPAVTVTDPAVTPMVKAAFAKVTDITGLAMLALELENVAAQTYQNGVAVLKSTQAISTAATIQPVEMQHAAILYYVLGKYPGYQSSSGQPQAFNGTQLARPPSDIGSTL